MSLFAAGVSTLGNTQGNTGTQYGTFVLAGTNNVTLSQITGTGGTHTIQISAGGGGGAGVAGIGISTGGLTAGTSGTQTGTYVLAGINGILLSQSTGAGVHSLTIAAPTIKLHQPVDFAATGAIANAQLSLVRFNQPHQMSATRLLLLGHMSGASNSTGGYTLSAGVFTMTGSTASLATSASGSLSWSSGSDTSASSRYGGQSGTQFRAISVNLQMTPGDYLLGVWMRTTNAGSWTFFGKSSISVANTMGITDLFGNGFTTASFTTAMPSSIHLTNYAKTGASANRQAGFILGGSL